jgi:hypothetical protein
MDSYLSLTTKTIENTYAKYLAITVNLNEKLLLKSVTNLRVLGNCSHYGSSWGFVIESRRTGAVRGCPSISV